MTSGASRYADWDDRQVRRVAQALADGVSPRAKARAMGVSVHKIRGQIDRVFGKGWWDKNIAGRSRGSR